MNVIMPRLVLASSSTERKRLLDSVGLTPDAIVRPEIDETPHKGEAPRAYVERMAREKAVKGASMIDGPALVLGADTISVVGRRIMGKPRDIHEARAYFSLFSGRAHRVHTGVAVQPTDDYPNGRACVKVVESRIAFAHMTREQIESLAEAGEWRRCSGGYSIRGHAALYIRAISGSYNSILGLPLFETAQMLRGQPGLRGRARPGLTSEDGRAAAWPV